MWKVKIIQEAIKDFQLLDRSLQRQVLKGILKVSQNPLPSPKGYGKPLGNKRGTNLTGFFKIKYRGIGIRGVYTIVLDEQVMNIIVVSKRDDEACYKLASQLYLKYGEDFFKDIFDPFL